RRGAPARYTVFPYTTLFRSLEAVSDRLDAERLRPALDSALAQLPAGQRDAVELRVVRALSYAEVASSLGCSEVAARIRVMRALRSEEHTSELQSLRHLVCRL